MATQEEFLSENAYAGEVIESSVQRRMRLHLFFVAAAAFFIAVGEGAFELAWLGALLVGATQWFSAGKPPLLKDRPLLIVGVGFVGALVLSLVSGGINGHPPRVSHMNHFVMAWGALAAWWMFPILGTTQLKRIWYCALAGASLALLAGFLQYGMGAFPGESFLQDSRKYIGQLYIPGSYPERAVSGILRNRLKMSESLLFVLSITLPVAFLSKERVLKGVAATFSVVAFLGMLLTFSKAAIGAILIAIIVVAFFHYWKWTLRFILPAMMVAIVVGMAYALYSGSLFTQEEFIQNKGSWAIRRWIWLHALEVWKDYPVWGCGVGTYAAVSEPYFPKDLYIWTHGTSPHNQYLLAFVEGGLVGGAAFLLLVGGIGWKLYSLWTTPPTSPLALGFLIGASLNLIAFYILNFVHTALYHPATALFMWISVGVLWGLPQLSESEN